MLQHTSARHYNTRVLGQSFQSAKATATTSSYHHTIIKCLAPPKYEHSAVQFAHMDRIARAAPPCLNLQLLISSWSATS